MDQKIVFNGKTYASQDEMPPSERKAYKAIRGVFADRDGNGMPDLLDGAAKINVGSASTRIFYEGEIYNGLEDLPPEARPKYQAAMAKLDADGNGIPDLIEERLRLHSDANQEPHPDWLTSGLSQNVGPALSSLSSPSINNAKNIEPEGVNLKILIISLVVIGILALGAVTLWVYLAQ